MLIENILLRYSDEQKVFTSILCQNLNALEVHDSQYLEVSDI